MAKRGKGSVRVWLGGRAALGADGLKDAPNAPADTTEISRQLVDPPDGLWSVMAGIREGTHGFGPEDSGGDLAHSVHAQSTPTGVVRVDPITLSGEYNDGETPDLTGTDYRPHQNPDISGVDDGPNVLGVDFEGAAAATKIVRVLVTGRTFTPPGDDGTVSYAISLQPVGTIVDPDNIS